MPSITDRPAALTAAAVLACVLPVAGPATGQDRGQSYTLYGTPGLIEMPAATGAPEGEFAVTFGLFDSQTRTTLSFQATPRLSASFRYAGVDDYLGPGAERFHDRSFDLRFRLLDETAARPALAVGLQDFLGTGLFTGEYVVASKALSDSLRVTAGLGWGRLGSANGFGNPLGALSDAFETRPELDPSASGRLRPDQFFRGDAALFGGVEWAATDKLTFKAEYSGDGYTGAQGRDRGIDPETQVNLGLSYAPLDNAELGLAWLHGTTLAFTGTVSLNPNQRTGVGGLDPAPVPVAARAPEARRATAWDRAALPEDALRDRLAAALAAEGVTLRALTLADRQARVRYANSRYRSEAQAMGRVARILTQALPPSVEIFVLEPMQRGIPLSAVILRRSDIETLENTVGAAAELRARAVVSDAGGRAAFALPPQERFEWGLAPYGRFALYDETEAAEVDIGAELSASYALAPNLLLSGALRKRVLGDDGGPAAASSPDVPAVRTDGPRYAAEGDPGLARLTLAHYGRPGPDLYSRVTVGYLERMFGGISTELLWKPVESDFALGAELNLVRKRDYDLGFGLRDYEVVTGHASAHYAFDNGFEGQIDVGRYLAGDWGATLSVDRAFENGWKVGAYVTRTDMSFDDYGIGSFDKGVRFTIPTDFVLGRPSRREVSTTLRAYTRDGGARLDVDGRLYDTVRDAHGALDEGWGRFWR